MDVTLRLIPPDEQNLVALRVYESSNGTLYSQIDRTEEIGTYPNYITIFTTPNATSRTDYFTVAWEDSTGAVGPMSSGVKGGTQSLISDVVRRVMERDLSLDQRVVLQEAEAAIQDYLGSDVDPYDDSIIANYQVKVGLTYLVMARVYTVMVATSSGSTIEQATIGLVSYKTQSGDNKNIDIGSLIDAANAKLGLGQSRIMTLSRPCSYGRYHEVVWP